MKSLYTFFCLFFASFLAAQTVADFENFNLSPGEYLNDSGSSHLFSSGHVQLPNEFVADPNFSYWSGWAISATTDVTTPGFSNEFSAITGGGVNGSTTYAVSYIYGTEVMKLAGNAIGGVVQGLYVTNSTYAYLSMLEGDGLAKKFGGVDGNDPDFFKIIIKKYLNGQLGEDSVEFYLADFRFANNTQDYIVNSWEYVDLTALGNVDSLEFSFASSDVGAFGINTPTYFCADNITTLDMPSATTEKFSALKFRAWPNPVTDFLQISLEGTSHATACLSNIYGQKLLEQAIHSGINRLEVSSLPNGIFTLQVTDGEQAYSQVFIKK